MLIYTVKPGDTVDSIAAAYGIPVSTIVYQNQIPYPYRLAIGEACCFQRLRVSLLPALQSMQADMPIPLSARGFFGRRSLISPISIYFPMDLQWKEN